MKPVELRVPLSEGGAAWPAIPHRDGEWLISKHRRARELNANLLVSIGPPGVATVTNPKRNRSPPGNGRRLPESPAWPSAGKTGQ